MAKNSRIEQKKHKIFKVPTIRIEKRLWKLKKKKSLLVQEITSNQKNKESVNEWDLLITDGLG